MPPYNNITIVSYSSSGIKHIIDSPVLTVNIDEGTEGRRKLMKKKIVWLPSDFDTALMINNEGSLVFS